MSDPLLRFDHVSARIGDRVLLRGRAVTVAESRLRVVGG